MQPKDYLSFENERNRQHAGLFIEMVREAFGNEWAALVGHHVLYQKGADLASEGEIPSADTLMFDHDIMQALFGDRAVEVMKELAARRGGDERDEYLEKLFRRRNDLALLAASRRQQ